MLLLGFDSYLMKWDLPCSSLSAEFLKWNLQDDDLLVFDDTD